MKRVIINYESIEFKNIDLGGVHYGACDKVRPGGRVIIPKSTYRYMAYEREGAEMLMLVNDLNITAPMPGQKDLVIGTK